ncbi:MAG: HD domain-containing protein [Lachnospiraceae bacterium]
MKRVWQIYCHPLFKNCLEKLKITEEKRIFCRHDLVHFFDVARLAYIFSMERSYEISKEEIYAAALLHDIGKWKQYTDGTPHERASAEIAEKILRDTGFSEEEQNRIISAILCHRKKNGQNESDPLAEILYDADKISRSCYACPAEPECNWSIEKKNLNITW